MSKNKYEIDYEIAQKVYKEFKDEGLADTHLKNWLEEKTKPEDPLFEKLKEFMKTVHVKVNGRAYTEFREIFKDELNGTRGLDEAISYVTENGWISASDHLKEIKARLENELKERQ